MKHKIAFLSFLLFMIMCSFGQDKEPQGYINHKKSRVENQIENLKFVENKYGKTPIFLKSKEASKNSKTNFSQTILSPTLIKYRLDNETTFGWDQFSSQWYNSWKSIYTYDVNGNLTLFIGLDWDVDIWHEYERYQYSYDGNGTLTQSIYYGQSEDIKTEYNYDINGNLIQETDFFWTGNIWRNNWKTEYVYDNVGNLIESFIYGWDLSQWFLDLKTEYSYGINGNLIQYIIYWWDGNQWIESSKKEYTYDANYKLTQINEYGYNMVENQWYAYSRTDYMYDYNDDLAQYIYYGWNGSQWYNNWKVEFIHNNSYSNSDLILPYFYNNISSFYSGVEVNSLYNHMITRAILYSWDYDFNDWIIGYNNDYSYSEQEILSDSEVSEDQLKIYPNPALNNLTIKSDGVPINKVEIFSILGKKIKEIYFDFDNIPTRNLSKGIYLIKISSEKGTTVKKLIKN